MSGHSFELHYFFRSRERAKRTYKIERGSREMLHFGVAERTARENETLFRVQERERKREKRRWR